MMILVSKLLLKDVIFCILIVYIWIIEYLKEVKELDDFIVLFFFLSYIYCFIVFLYI